MSAHIGIGLTGTVLLIGGFVLGATDYLAGDLDLSMPLVLVVVGAIFLQVFSSLDDRRKKQKQVGSRVGNSDAGNVQYETTTIKKDDLDAAMKLIADGWEQAATIDGSVVYRREKAEGA